MKYVTALLENIVVFPGINPTWQVGLFEGVRGSILHGVVYFEYGCMCTPESTGNTTSHSEASSLSFLLRVSSADEVTQTGRWRQWRWWQRV